MSILTTSLLVLSSIAAIIFLTSRLKLNAFISLFLVSLFLAVTAIPNADIVKILKDGFGNTMGSIGFLIIFGAIIAGVLEKSGAALSIANYLLSKTGEKRAPAAMGITGFLAGLPIFCDSGYIILSGLAKSFSAKTKIPMPFIAIVLACSLYAVHCLVPMHPGALAAAGIMNVNIGNFILAGILFALPGALVAFYWTRWMTKNKDYQPAQLDVEINGLDDRKLPSVFLSLLPIVVPLLLIAIASLFSVLGWKDQNYFYKAVLLIGQPIMALFVGMLLSFSLLIDKSIHKLNLVFEAAIEKAGPILIVTAAGGMFGMVIKETGIGVEAGNFLSKTGLGLAVPFLIAFLMKTAQGSSTVAIITTASFVAPMLQVLGLDSESGRLFATLAMGAGSMMISHANDSYFWVITKFSGMESDTTLKIFSTATIVMGITVFACIWVSAQFIL
ncbi:MAG TPA: gluconate transporter [Prolixibacteraceae bacterium]|nr:gluconate transporter [Prolixibacteraceae bacterium]